MMSAICWFKDRPQGRIKGGWRTFPAMLSERNSDAIMPGVSPLIRFYLATLGWLVLVPATFLVDSYNHTLGQGFLLITVGVFLASTIYAQRLACPKCGWRIASFGKPFVRSLPPRKCPHCGTDLLR